MAKLEKITTVKMERGCKGFMSQNLINMKFGNWAVISEVKSTTKDKRWLCRCTCGNEREVFGKYLRNGKSKSCGCLKSQLAENKVNSMVGEKFGKLMVLETIGTVEKQTKDRIKRQTLVKCKCDCGNVHITDGRKIKDRKSCGCDGRVPFSQVGTRFGKLVITEMVYSRENRTWCKCTCDCGQKDFLVMFTSLKNGNTESCGCIQTPDLTGKEFGYLTVVKELGRIRNQRTWECRCKCGQIIQRKTSHLSSGHTSSCGCMKSEQTSRCELFIANILSEISVSFVTQKSFKDCRGYGDRPLKFDFYIQSKNLLIEYDGIQHFKPIEFWGGIEGLRKQQQNDEIKNQYCKVNNICLLRLPYTLTDMQIVEAISQRIFENPVTTTAAWVTMSHTQACAISNALMIWSVLHV